MTDEQEGLLKKARESAQAAQLLVDGGYAPFATSRAYYAMFYVAEAFLLGEGLSFSSHKAVIAAFGNRFARTGIVPTHFHRYLIDGMDRRTEVDYDIDPDVRPEDAKAMIDQAQQFIALAERLLA